MRRKTTTAWPQTTAPTPAPGPIEALRVGQRLTLTADKESYTGTVVDTRESGWFVQIAYTDGAGQRCQVWRLASEVRRVTP